MLHHILEIASHLKSFETDPLLAEVVLPMRAKFLKYWKTIPLLYSFAFVLDPRAKMKGFINILNLLSNLVGLEYSDYYNTVRSELINLFGKYEAKFAGVRLQRPPQPTSQTGRKRTAWGKIFGATSTSSTSTSTTDSVPATATSVPLVDHASELSSYLDSDPITQYDDDFNILSWWQNHKRTYPVLSILARDVMTVPVSTISSESTFSLVGRVIEDRRRSLTSDMVEMISCVKDWELGSKRAQHTVENEVLQETFENMFLDVEE